MQNSDIVDVVGITPVPSPLPSSTDPPDGEDVDDDDDSKIRCICGNEEDDGFTIQCDSCFVWQHAGCVGIARNSVPEVYLCEECRPDEQGGLTGKRKKSTRENSLPALNEINANIVAMEALNELRYHAERYEEVKLKMPRLSRDIPLGQVNFELSALVAFPSPADLKESTKSTALRELRLRSLGKRNVNLAKFGIFAGEDIDPGAFIGEYLGHVQPISALSKGKNVKVENTGQSYVLFSPTTPKLVVDARKFGNNLRYIRRSCRANCEVKLVLIPSNDIAEAIHWCLFARNTIRENEELFLPFDYNDGNQFFRYECCCLYPELCLADDMIISHDDSAIDASPISGGSNKKHAGSMMVMANSTIYGSKSHTNQTNKKLSREERKLQQYIEFIERMESAERKHGRKSGSVATSGNSGTASPTSSHTPPKKTRKSSKTSPKQSMVEATKMALISPELALSASSPTKRMLPLKKFLSKSITERKSSSISESPVKTGSKIDLVSETTDEVDVIDLGESSPASGLAPVSVLPTTTTTSNPDTPSKKRVSLSAYLSRRKSSPVYKLSSSELLDSGLDDHPIVPGGINSSLGPHPSSTLNRLIDDNEHRKSELAFVTPSPLNQPISVQSTRYTTPPPPIFTEYNYHHSQQQHYHPHQSQSLDRERWRTNGSSHKPSQYQDHQSFFGDNEWKHEQQRRQNRRESHLHKYPLFSDADHFDRRRDVGRDNYQDLDGKDDRDHERDPRDTEDYGSPSRGEYPYDRYYHHNDHHQGRSY